MIKKMGIWNHVVINKITYHGYETWKVDENGREFDYKQGVGDCFCKPKEDK